MEFLTQSTPALSPAYVWINRWLGGEAVLHRLIESPQEAHARIREGLPVQAVTTLLEALPGLPAQSVLEFIGTNERSLRRRRASATANSVARLTCKESDRLWRLAESLAEAALVLGDVKSAEVWMTRPQLGLSVQRPIELLATSPGAQLVKAFLLRLEYGVYVFGVSCCRRLCSIPSSLTSARP